MKLNLFAVGLFTVVASLSSALPVTAHAELQIEIAKSFTQAPKVAIVPFEADQTLHPIITANLNRSGQLSSASSLPERPTRTEDINLAAWQSAGVPYVVVGRVTAVASGFEVQYELMDIQKNTRLLGEKINVPANRMREAAHLISDKIYQALTGVAGDFSGRIAYVLRDRKNGKPFFTLQIADSDGQQPRTVLESVEPILSPTWTPDGRKLAYVSFETGRPAIYLQDLASGERETLAQFKGLNGAPSFSPDGKNMLLTASKDGNPEIYLMNLASKSVQRLTNDSAIDTEARFAPDGKSFVFTSDRGGTPQIYRYNLDSGQVKRITFNGRFNARGSLSKDGQSLALVHRQSGQQFQVGIMDLASGVISILTPTPLDESPSFSPNGQMVVYATRERGRGMLAIMSTDGRFRMNLPSESGEVREPAWAPALR